MASLCSCKLPVPRRQILHSSKLEIEEDSKPKTNHRATIMLDDVETESGVMIECEPKILTGAKAKKFRDRMRRVMGWQNDETTFIIVLTPKRKARWFLKE